MSKKWHPDSYLIATRGVATKVTGLVYRGLGLDRRAEGWVLTHLGMGLKIAVLGRARFAAEIIATEVAECGDWDWESPEGDKNKDPDILSRAGEILWGHRDMAKVLWTSPGEPQRWRKDMAPSIHAVVEARAA